MCDTGTHILFYLDCSTRRHKLDKLSGKEFFQKLHMISIFQAKYVQCVIMPIPPHAKSGLILLQFKLRFFLPAFVFCTFSALFGRNNINHAKK